MHSNGRKKFKIPLVRHNCDILIMVMDWFSNSQTQTTMSWKYLFGEKLFMKVLSFRIIFIDKLLCIFTWPRWLWLNLNCFIFLNQFVKVMWRSAGAARTNTFWAQFSNASVDGAVWLPCEPPWHTYCHLPLFNELSKGRSWLWN